MVLRTIRFQADQSTTDDTFLADLLVTEIAMGQGRVTGAVSLIEGWVKATVCSADRRIPLWLKAKLDEPPFGPPKLDWF